MFSAPPAASPTFSVAPGGTCCLAKHPLQVRSHILPGLGKWEGEGRLVSVMVLMRIPVCVIGIYGYPAGHPQRLQNEALIADIFYQASRLTMPVLIMGDFNTSPQNSSPMTLSESWGFWKVSSDRPTTLSKRTGVASGVALDHAYANAKALDLGFKMDVSCFASISDHLPLVGSLNVPEFPLVVWKWPRPTHSPPD